jgi:GT2 family glycosyltransferase
MTSEVHLSVIIASHNSAATISRCLTSLRSLQNSSRFEVIVVDSSPDGAAAIVERDFPGVRLIWSAERLYPGDARNRGISGSRGNIIAFVDADCVVPAGWADSVLTAHQRDVLAVGGSIGNLEPSGWIAWAAYFCEFSRWMPGTRERWMDDVASASMSYKRRAFEEFGTFIPGTYCSDTEFHWRLVASGNRIWFTPELHVDHGSLASLGRFLSHEYCHGRSFARVRSRALKFSRLRRALYVALWWLLPFRLFAAIAMRNLRNRIYLSHFISSLPLLICGLVSWSFGECVGYLRRDAPAGTRERTVLPAEDGATPSRELH